MSDNYGKNALLNAVTMFPKGWHFGEADAVTQLMVDKAIELCKELGTLEDNFWFCGGMDGGIQLSFARGDNFMGIDILNNGKDEYDFDIEKGFGLVYTTEKQLYNINREAMILEAKNFLIKHNDS